MPQRFDTSTDFPESIWNPRHYAPATAEDGSPRTMWLLDDGSLDERADDVSAETPGASVVAVYQQGEDDPGRFDRVWARGDSGAVGTHPQKIRWEALDRAYRNAPDEQTLRESIDAETDGERRAELVHMATVVRKETFRKARSEARRKSNRADEERRKRSVPRIRGGREGGGRNG